MLPPRREEPLLAISPAMVARGRGALHHTRDDPATDQVADLTVTRERLKRHEAPPTPEARVDSEPDSRREPPSETETYSVGAGVP